MNDSDAKVKVLFTNTEKAQILGKIQKDLPGKWVVQFSNKHANRVYFFNKADGTRTWQHPGLNSSKAKSSEKERPHRKRRSDETKVEEMGAEIREETAKPFPETFKQRKRKSGQSEKIPVGSEVQEKSIQSPPKRTKKKRRGKSSKAQTLPGFTGVSNPMVLPEAAAKEVAPTPQSGVMALSRDVPISADIQVKEDGMARCSTPQDIEMTELAEFPSSAAIPVQQAKDIKISAMERRQQDFSATGKSFFVIIDTNILLSSESLDCIQKVLDRKRTEKVSPRKFVYIIPWVVLQELDHLKKTMKNARDAISFLNTQFQANHSLIRGQSIFEAASIVDGLTIENNDDRILQCCFSMRNLTPGSVSLLLTRDKNLTNKALANKIKCFEDVMFIWKLAGDKKICTETTSGQLSLSKIQEHQSEETKIDSKNGNSSRGSEKKRTLEPQEIRDIYSKSRAHILSALTFILEKEMKDAFSHLWLDIVLKKPPWSLKDLLLCVRKHWLSVFKQMGVDRLVQVHVTRLLDSCNNSQPEDEDFVKNWLLCGRGLVVAIDEKGKYGEPVRSDLAELQNLQRRLFPTSHRQEKASSTAAEVPAIEMTIAANESKDFWTALDKIWTSIISHCGMIFQSLDFVPSHLASAPELGEALSATFDSIPPAPLAARALPFVTDLVQSVETSLQRLVTSSVADQNCEAVFMDLLQTLWTTIQAFRIDCDVRPLIHLRSEICTGILTSDAMTQRLKTGLQQLEVVKRFLGECLTTVMAKW